MKRAVLERARTSYIAQTVWCDDDGLENIEAMQAAQARGRPRVDEVRLPEPGA